MKALFAVLFVVMMAVACAGFPGCVVDQNIAVRAADTQGFTNIHIVDRDPYFVQLKGGSKDDVVRFKVEATNPAGKQVTLYVFAGWPFKGATIRTP